MDFVATRPPSEAPAMKYVWGEIESPLITFTSALVSWIPSRIARPSFEYDDAANPKPYPLRMPGMLVPSGSMICSSQVPGDDPGFTYAWAYKIILPLKQLAGCGM